MLWFVLAALLLGPGPVLPRPAPVESPIVVDTDAGSDDYMALALLLARSDVTIDAITIVNGLAHVEAGARNVSRLCELAGRGGIPVYAGESAPLEETAPFPDEWRHVADALPGVDLPEARRAPGPEGAVDFLTRVLGDTRRRRLLTLGPLTNLARALERVPAGERRGVESVVIMGGAVSVDGNLADGGYFRTENRVAEWNMFADPRAAEIVFGSGLPIVLVPLDATNKVPIREGFVRDFTRRATTPLGKFVAAVLDGAQEPIARDIFYAFDPLAAVVLLDRGVVTLRPGHVQVLRRAASEGRTWLISGKAPNAQIAFGADSRRFRRIFESAFAPPGR